MLGLRGHPRSLRRAPLRRGCGHDCERRTPTATWRWGAPRARSSSSARCRSFGRRESPCSGALTWLWADPWAGAGWGSIDVDGRPKSAWYGMRRASRPVAIALTNEGLDGVDLHVWNDTSECPWRARCTFASCATAATSPSRRACRSRCRRTAARRTRSTACSAVHRRCARLSIRRCGPRRRARRLDERPTSWPPAASDAAHSRFGGVPIIDEAALLVHGDRRPMSETGPRGARRRDRRQRQSSTLRVVRGVARAAGARRKRRPRRERLVLHAPARRRAARPPGTARERGGGPIVVQALNDRACCSWNRASAGGRCAGLRASAMLRHVERRARCCMSGRRPRRPSARGPTRRARALDSLRRRLVCRALARRARRTVRRRVAILCPSIGSERIRGERAFRILGDRLAARGVSTLRFDYPATGNSTGDAIAAGGSEPNLVERWCTSIADAAAHATQLVPGAEIVLVGRRLGALLAMEASRSMPGIVTRCVLWDPPASGRTFVRELRLRESARFDHRYADELAREHPVIALQWEGHRFGRRTVEAIERLTLRRVIDAPRGGRRRRERSRSRRDVDSGERLDPDAPRASPGIARPTRRSTGARTTDPRCPKTLSTPSSGASMDDVPTCERGRRAARGASRRSGRFVTGASTPSSRSSCASVRRARCSV